MSQHSFQLAQDFHGLQQLARGRAASEGHRVTVFTDGLGAVDEATQRRLESRGITLIPAPVVEVSGDDTDCLVIRADDAAEIGVDVVFTVGTSWPHDDFLAHLSLDHTDTPFGRFLAVDATGKTSSDRIWAAGNIINPAANIPMSIGAGAATGGAVNAALLTRDFDAATEWSQASPADFWENRYAGTNRAWSDRPDHNLVEIAQNLPPGQTLDLGCGEGADVIWLAQHGWTATGLDISPTAIRRATEAASGAEISEERVRFKTADLSTWAGKQDYELVTASFLHSPVNLPRTDILRRASELIAPGGHLLVVSHCAAPPWASAEDVRKHRFLTPKEELETLHLDEDTWSVVLAETRTHPATAPDGEHAELDDTVILLQRGPDDHTDS